MSGKAHKNFLMPGVLDLVSEARPQALDMAHGTLPSYDSYTTDLVSIFSDPEAGRKTQSLRSLAIGLPPPSSGCNVYPCPTASGPQADSNDCITAVEAQDTHLINIAK